MAAGSDFPAGTGADVGTYRLLVTDATDDFPADTTSAGTVAVGGSATGEIEVAGDQDWFAVELVAGKTYRIDLTGWQGFGGGPWWTISAATSIDGGPWTLPDPFLRGLSDANGDRIANTADDDSGPDEDSRLIFAAATTGTHYIAAGAPGGSFIGTYQLSVTEITVAADDFPAATSTTGVVAVGGSVTGRIEISGDRDWFAVELVAGTVYQIDLERQSLADPFLRGLYDANGDRIANTTDNDGGSWDGDSQVAYLATMTGTYYIAAGGEGGHVGTYRLSVSIIPDDFPSDSSTLGTVAVDGSATGEIEYEGDRDWFAVELVTGRTYRIDLKGYDDGGGSLYDPHLRGLYDADGVRIANTQDEDDGTDQNASVTYTATTTGMHYIAASGRQGGPIFTDDTYTLAVTDVTDLDDFPADSSTTGTVVVEGSARGEIERPGDQDWFAVDLAAGQLYQVDLRGWDKGHGTLDNPYLRGIYDQTGTLIADTRDNNGGPWSDARVMFTPSDAGTYYVAAGAFEGEVGTYKLSVKIDEHTDDTDTTGRVAVDGTATGDIEYYGDHDWFAVDLEADRTYRIDLKGSRNGDGTLWNPLLYGIYDDTGIRLPGTQDDSSGAGTNARVTFTPAATGTYYVAATNSSRFGTLSDGTYTLAVTDVTAGVPDDYPDDTSTTGTVAVGGSITGEVEFLFDEDWFAVTLEAGQTYRFDLKGRPTGDGTLHDPYLYGIYDDEGSLIAGTTDDDSGSGESVYHNSQVMYTATEDGTHYVAAGAWVIRFDGLDLHANDEGTYELSVTDITDP